jgi:type I restriction enzyme S subunit
MSNKLDTKAVKPESKRVLKPKLRFPEFKGEPEWNTEKLGAIATIITERAGNRKCIPMSITSGVGLVSQQEKFGRTIAGNQYENYLVLQKDDFAYNKSATKEFPQGFIAKYLGDEPAAVPNSIFTCFRARKDGIVPDFLGYLFVGNLHGKWLKKYIEVSARAHGSLSIDDEILLSLPIPLPSGGSSLAEQQKIVACLTSLDELIGAHRQKLDALEAYKKGLMQQLFPREGETIPRFRFPEFQYAAEWVEKQIGDLQPFVTSGSRGWAAFYADQGQLFVRMTNLSRESILLDLTDSKFVQLPMGANEGVRTQLKEHDVLISITADIGIIGYVDASVPSPAYINQHIALVRFDESQLCGKFVAYFLASESSERLFRVSSDVGTKAGMSLPGVQKIKVVLPSPPEQRRIADCLTSLDDLIAAQTHKLAALKTHKKGLMQQLFPSPEEAL